MTKQVILRVVSKILIPAMVVFALYVHFHGDYGPGGGFQAGVIIAAAVVLYALIFGLSAARKAVPPALVEAGVPLGVLIFGGVGVAGWLLGGNFLDYNVLDPADPAHGQHLGVILVELGVIVTVASTMLAIFYTFAGRGR